MMDKYQICLTFIPNFYLIKNKAVALRFCWILLFVGKRSTNHTLAYDHGRTADFVTSRNERASLKPFHIFFYLYK